MTTIARPALPDACDGCLRRAMLLGVLAPRIQAVLGSRSRAPGGVLALEDRDLIAAVGGHATGASAFLERFDASEQRRAVAQRGVEAICRHSDLYPGRLRELGDAPAVLFGMGQVRRALDEIAAIPTVAIVGSRRASTYGLEMARSIGRGLAAAGVPVVSGLALGIDAAAHEGCLAGEGLAVAVLGGGADVPYPRTNEGLYERVRSGGAILAEMPPGHRPYRWGFPARNRIMAGLASATLVVEAAERSGSLITTDCAADLGRLVAVVPGQATNRGAAGSNALLRSGAPLIGSTRDLLDEVFGVGQRLAGAPGAGSPSREVPDGLTAVVLEGVEKGWPLDRICRESDAGIGEVRGALSRLESSGRVARDGLGGYRARAVEAT